MMKIQTSTFIMSLILLAGSAVCDENPSSTKSILERDSLFDNWFALGTRLEEETGISTGLCLTQVYQLNLSEGAAANTTGQLGGTHRHEGRFTGSYDFEMEMDLEKLLGMRGGKIFMLVEGGWSDGLDDSSVGSFFGVNGDAMGDQAIQISEFWYQQNLLDNRLRFRIGKMDLSAGCDCHGASVGFDGNAFANDECSQFLNGSLVNNPTIPFPDYALGVLVYFEPIDGFYVAAAAADTQADGRETGFNMAFHDEDYFFGIMETGLVTTLAGNLTGAYRVGMWYDPQDKARFHGRSTKRDDIGFYLSFDQFLYKENDSDDQGLGCFFRYGWADSDVSDIRCFWSTGLQYAGLIPGRDADVLGIGYANGKRGADSGLTAEREQMWEVYYNMEITPWLHVAPNFQFVQNPGCTADIDAAVVGVRVHLSF